MIDTLRAIDPAAWNTGLSPENNRASWLAALACVDPPALERPIPGTPPRAVLIVASGNVFTAPVEWCLQLAARGVQVILKPPSGQEECARALAATLPGVTVRTWEGGDASAEAAAVGEADAVIAFGRAETLSAIAGRLPRGKRFLPFGPRFGISVVGTPDARTVTDHVLYDGRGCMSPAAVFAKTSDIDAIASWMAEAEARLPRGPLTPDEAARIRARVTLARAVGERRSGPNWTVLRMPPAHFWPEALPRLLVVHPIADVSEVDAAIAPFRKQLGTVATDLVGFNLGSPRVCRPGEMQLPLASRKHDGVDVLAALWMTSR